MLTFYAPGQRGVVMDDMASCPELTRDAVWIDVFSPTPDEEKELEAALGTGIPTREEMQAIELSSRLYEESGILFLTATVLSKSASMQPESLAITFILTKQKLVTLRYADPAPFAAFRARREAHVDRYTTGYQVLGGLIDAIVERVADILEGAALNLDQLSARVFDRPVATSLRTTHNPLGRTPKGSARKARQRDFVEILTLIGSSSDLVSRVRESIVSWVRLVTFFREVRKEEPAARETIRAFQGGARRPQLAERSREFSLEQDRLPPRCDPRDDQQRAERDHQDPVRRSAGVPAAYAGRRRLRNELRGHAGTEVGAGVSIRARTDAGRGRAAISAFPAQRLAVGAMLPLANGRNAVVFCER
jgi:Mg2+ and Co2+ transporter CorA